MIICHITKHIFWTGETRTITEFDPIPPMWIVTDPPADPQPDKYYRYTSGAWQELSIEEAEDILLSSKPRPTVDDVGAERDRRLALGFYYDFGDERGVHKIGTTPRDMEGWNQVTQLKDVMFQVMMANPASDAINQPMTQISTATGRVVITAAEWLQIFLYAAQHHQQPLWQKSFDLQAMNPIPLDYTNDVYWTNSIPEEPE